MKVQSIGSFNGYVSHRSTIQNLRNGQNKKVVQNPSFGSIKGALIGGSVGIGVTGFVALAALASGPLGWLAGLTYMAATTGGAAVGGAVGHAISGEDEGEL